MRVNWYSGDGLTQSQALLANSNVAAFAAATKFTAPMLAIAESRNLADVRREALVRNMQRYWGVTGPLALDAAGERRVADFDFWNVTEAGDWVRTASYASGRLVR